ncbi:ATP-dependent Clp protease ATP-binding subunit [Escherichia coli]|uniref:ATP-dependent Clp protease ATP-binding subunit n=1 Tax=Escherichia coli TaxID=562 RepID=A0A377AVP9_ECOLX|nr:ATP-dependent Clp protease ATP-binding subunit [Escherichia coli]
MVLVMTTNAGVRETERKSIGLIHQDNSTDAMEEIKKIFTPEFRNRLDNIIWFDHLSTDVIHQVVDNSSSSCRFSWIRKVFLWK